MSRRDRQRTNKEIPWGFCQEVNEACNRFFESRNMPNGKQAFMMEHSAEIKRSIHRKNRAQSLAETAAEVRHGDPDASKLTSSATRH